MLVFYLFKGVICPGVLYSTLHRGGDREQGMCVIGLSIRGRAEAVQKDHLETSYHQKQGPEHSGHINNQCEI